MSGSGEFFVYGPGGGGGKPTSFPIVGFTGLLSWGKTSRSVDGHLRTYDLRTGSLTTDLIGHPITSLTLTTDTAGLLLSTLDSHIRLFDKTTGACLQTYTGAHTNKDYRVRSCVGGPGDAWVLTGSEDGRVVAYDLMDAREVAVLKGLHAGKVVSAVAFHPKGRQWVSAGVDGEWSFALDLLVRG